jgi:hypothetical protein
VRKHADIIGAAAILVGLLLGVRLAQWCVDEAQRDVDGIMQSPPGAVEYDPREAEKRQACERHKGREYVPARDGVTGFCVVRP